MDEQSKAALDLLVQNGYLEIVKEKYRPTKKLNEVPQVVILGERKFVSWEDAYIWFIQDCNIPKHGESGTGELYELNKYTEDAMKHFRDLIRSGIRYEILSRVTTTYYKTGSRRFKKKIGNYITEGHWRMDYEVMKDKPLEDQQKHLNQQINESKPFTRDRIG